MKNIFRFFAFLLVIAIFINFSYAEGSGIYINTRSVKLINRNTVWLTGSINNLKYVREYGFAVSHFPFPPLKDQEVKYYEIEGIPLHNSNFTYLLQDLEAGRNYFVAAYYKKGNKYYYADNHSFATPRSVKATLPVLNIETENRVIEVPINFERTAAVLAADITIEYDSHKLEFQEIVTKGLDGYYKKSILHNGSGSKTTINVKWCAESEFLLEDIALTYLFKLKSSILTSGNTPITIKASFIDENGQSIAVETADGIINYQHKSEKLNFADKYFSDDDLVYDHKQNESKEKIEVKHFTQIMYARWQQARGFFQKNKTPIEIVQNYAVAAVKPEDRRLTYEETVLEFFGGQKKDLISARCGLRYTSLYNVSLDISDAALQQLDKSNKPWQIKIAPLNDLEKKKIIASDIISAWKIDVGLSSVVEIKLPIAKNTFKEKLRIRADYPTGQQLDLVPYYIKDILGNEFACIEAVPDACFAIYELDKKTFSSKLGSTRFTQNSKSIEIGAKTYISEENTLMIPLNVLKKCFGLEVEWDKDNNQILIRDGRSIRLTVGGKVVQVDLEARLLNSEPVLINNIVFLSSEIFEKVLNAKVSYSYKSQKIQIRY